MTETANRPKFVSPESASASSTEKRNAWIMGMGGCVIALFGLVVAFHIWSLVPYSQFDALCQEEYYELGISDAFDHSYGWLAAAVWSAFAALMLVTWSRSKAWATAASIAGGMMGIGALVSAALIVGSYSCQG